MFRKGKINGIIGVFLVILTAACCLLFGNQIAYGETNEYGYETDTVGTGYVYEKFL